MREPEERDGNIDRERERGGREKERGEREGREREQSQYKYIKPIKHSIAHLALVTCTATELLISVMAVKII